MTTSTKTKISRDATGRITATAMRRIVAAMPADHPAVVEFRRIAAMRVAQINAADADHRRTPATGQELAGSLERAKEAVVMTYLATHEPRIIMLDVVPNGSQNSLIADDGTIYATGGNSREMLREAAWVAHRAGYSAIMIGAQSWDIDRLVAD